ncbi:MAG: sigma-70 family RNA polymerase sigma factor [Syntrophomonadaceae bacterium]
MLNPPPLVSDDLLSIAIEKYADMVRRICFLYLKDKAEVEDVFQDVFLQYFLHIETFRDEQHHKAWLCRVTFNKCKDMNKSIWRRRAVSIENLEIPFENPEQGELVTAVLQLPLNYRQIIYLHYYEGWTIPEIAEIMQQNVNTVYTQLRRAKARLKHKVEVK